MLVHKMTAYKNDETRLKKYCRQIAYGLRTVDKMTAQKMIINKISFVLKKYTK